MAKLLIALTSKHQRIHAHYIFFKLTYQQQVHFAHKRHLSYTTIKGVQIEHLL